MDRRTVGLLLLLLQVATIVFLTRAYVAAPLAFVFALIGYAGWMQWKATPFRTVFACLVVMLFYVVRAVYFPPAYAGRFAALGEYRFYIMASLAFLTMQAIPFFSKKDAPAFQLLPLAGIVSLVLAGNVNTLGFVNIVYQASVLLYVAGIAVFALAPVEGGEGPVRRWRWGVSALLFGLLIAIAMAGTITLGTFGHEFDRFIVGAIKSGSGRMGFNNKVQLNRVTELRTSDDKEQIALRVYSEALPGYLRGLAFLEPSSTLETWSRVVVETRLMPVIRPSVFGLNESSEHENYFSLMNHSSPTWRDLEVWPALGQDAPLFIPKDSGMVRLNAEELYVDACHVPQLPDSALVSHYAAFVPSETPKETLEPEDRRLATSVPEGMDPRVIELAHRVFEGRETAGEKIVALKDFFARNFAYDLHFEAPEQENVISYFLLERRAGHCELFASSAALMLRIGGVPSRYVIGFVTSERNGLGDYWIARNKDAHAWVEAYDDEQQQWVIVETTPSDGIPEAEPRWAFLYGWDSLVLWSSQLATMIAERGLVVVAEAIAYVIVNWLDRPVARVLVVGVGGAIAVWVLARFVRKRRQLAQETDALTRQAEAMLKRMDAIASRTGIYRAPSETLHRFAERIRHVEGPEEIREGIAHWYEHFAGLRFSGGFDEDSARELDKVLAEVSQVARTVRF